MHEHVRYSIIESCMRPSGAYAHTQGSYAEEGAARAAFKVAYFQGPGFGIISSRTLSLHRSYFENSAYKYEVLAQRNCD